ncbi:c-type cytochrome [Salinimicrobium gaetbulicola]|uniref:C-type cytochrome n=1 Tax=Salinimicrobium gaetbulicola TaxID=999702 RepID=A0ABW3IFC7_9FLAO
MSGPSNLRIAPDLLRFSLSSLIVFSFLLTGCKEKEYSEISAAPGEIELQEANADQAQKDLVKRGEYLITSIGCADCHSPKKMGERGPEEDPELKLSGYRQGNELPPIDQNAVEKGWILFTGDLTASVGPWGVSFAANLTSDETGIGNWTYEQFETAIRQGKYKGMKNNRDLLPPMPWPSYGLLSDDDLKAMFAYLKSTKPIKNAVPAPIPPDKIARMKKQ